MSHEAKKQSACTSSGLHNHCSELLCECILIVNIFTYVTIIHTLNLAISVTTCILCVADYHLGNNIHIYSNDIYIICTDI